MLIPLTVRLFIPESVPERELIAAERDLTEWLAFAAKMTALPKGAFIEFGGERVEQINLEEVPRG